jgi:hypothetical protein
MLTETFRSIAAATRNVFRNWQSLLLIAIVYASLLAVLYLFVWVKEATYAQVTLTFASAVAVPLLFFVLQAMIASEGTVATETADVPPPDHQTAGSLLKRSLSSFWKLILITLPLIGLAILVAYLLGKAQNHWGQPPAPPLSSLHPMASPNAPRSQPIEWRVALFSTIRYLAFGLVLPLLAIHLWLATVRDGLGSAIRRIAALLSRAFGPQSVLIYIVGFLIFAVVPYFLLFKTTQTKHAWLELVLLIARLAIVFAMTLFGWTITVRALGQPLLTPQRDGANEAT